MGQRLASLALLCLGAPALAQDAPRASASATASTAFVSGPVGAAWNPSMQLGLRLGGRYAVSDTVSAAASWTVTRDQVLCDTCDEAGGPGTGGSGTGHVLDTSDLRVSMTHERVAGSSDGLRLAARIDGALPASRDAFVCNPFYGAVGAGSTLIGPLQDAALSADVSVSRSFFRYDAAPVGLCGLSLADYDGTETLTGTVQPAGWSGDRYGSNNTAWTGAIGLALSDPHTWVLRKAPKLSTSIGIGLNAQRRRAGEAATVQTLTGPVTVGAARVPVVTAVPISVGGGWAMGNRMDLWLTVANTIPTVLDDPGAYYRNIPARTAVRLALTGRW